MVLDSLDKKSKLQIIQFLKGGSFFLFVFLGVVWFIYLLLTLTGGIAFLQKQFPFLQFLFIDRSTLSFLISCIFFHGLHVFFDDLTELVLERGYFGKTKEDIEEILHRHSIFGHEKRRASVFRILREVDRSVEGTRGFLADHVHNLINTFFVQKGNVDQQSLLSPLVNRFVTRKRKYHVRILPLIGFIGTLIGIIMVFKVFSVNVGQLTEADDFVLHFRSILFSSMQGLDTAFYTSLFGAFLGGICLYLLFGMVEQQKYSLLDEIELFAAVRILPWMNRPHQMLIDDASKEAMLQLSTSLEEIRVTHSKLSRSLDKHRGVLDEETSNLYPIVLELKRTVEELHQTVQDQTKQLSRHPLHSRRESSLSDHVNRGLDWMRHLFLPWSHHPGGKKR